MPSQRGVPRLMVADSRYGGSLRGHPFQPNQMGRKRGLRQVVSRPIR